MQGIKKDIDLGNKQRQTSGGGTHTVITLVVEGTDDNTTAEAIYGVNVVKISTFTDYCCKLPAGVTGKTVIIQNTSGGPIDVYPPDPTSQISSAGPGQPVQIPNDWGQYTFICTANPTPSQWSYNQPTSFIIDSGVLAMPTHTFANNGWNGAGSTHGWFESNGTFHYPPLPNTSFTWSWGNGTATQGYLTYGGMPGDPSTNGPNWFKHTTSPATINKIWIFSNIKDEALLGSGTQTGPNLGQPGKCSNNTYPCTQGPPGSVCPTVQDFTADNDFGKVGGMPHPGFQMMTPYIFLWRSWVEQMVTGTVTDASDPTKLVDENQDFSTCFVGNPCGLYPVDPLPSPICNFGSTYISAQVGQPNCRIQYPTAISTTVNPNDTVSLTNQFGSMSVGDSYGMYSRAYFGMELIIGDIGRPFCYYDDADFFPPFAGSGTWDCSTSWVNPWMCRDWVNPIFNGAPTPGSTVGGTGTLYQEIDISSLPPKDRQIGSTPTGQSIVAGQTAWYPYIMIPAQMDTKDYEFQIIFECI